jgi:hypothetical protein
VLKDARNKVIDLVNETNHSAAPSELIGRA